jgi:hypothetical protein
VAAGGAGLAANRKIYYYSSYHGARCIVGGSNQEAGLYFHCWVLGVVAIVLVVTIHLKFQQGPIQNLADIGTRTVKLLHFPIAGIGTCWTTLWMHSQQTATTKSNKLYYS